MSATRLGAPPLAHPVHDVSVGLRMAASATLLTALAGCPSLSVETDAGTINSPPAITSLSADEQVLPDSGELNFAAGVIGSTMIVGLIDSDVGDRLYVRMFVDYRVQDPDPARAECDAEPTGTVRRTCQADITALCPEVGEDFFLTVQVFDREPLPSGIPQFKRMEDPNGLTTNRSFILNCLEAP